MTTERTSSADNSEQLCVFRLAAVTGLLIQCATSTRHASPPQAEAKQQTTHGEGSNAARAKSVLLRALNLRTLTRIAVPYPGIYLYRTMIMDDPHSSGAV